MKLGLLLAAALVLAHFVMAQDTASAPRGTIVFEFDWPAQAVPHYQITVDGAGNGAYSPVPGPGADAKGLGAGKRVLRISPPVLARIFAVSPLLTGGKPCEARQKNLAQTGRKTLTLRVPDGKVFECVYNYSEDKRVQDATTIFQGIALTMDEGSKLARLHRFDRLGLDAEMDLLEKAAQDGRALELANIAPTLRTLAGDTELMQRVRLRAAKLLDRSTEGLNSD